MNKAAFEKIKLTPQETLDYVRQTAAFERQLEELTIYDNDGFFAKDSMTWKIYRQPTVMLGGVSALLLQIANPAIAEGVRQFSDFHEAYLQRAHRTFMSMSTFYFGTTEQALKTARRLFAMHGMIRGKIGKIINGQWQLVPFCARDAELLTWVLATLVETSLRMYQKIHAPLTLEAQTQFFEESKTIAILMGIPLEKYPANYEAFKKYYCEVLSGNDLAVNPTTMRLTNIILQPPYGSHKLFRAMAAVYLPEHIAHEYHLPPSPIEKKWMHRLEKWTGRILKIMPPIFRYAPPYHQAKYRRLKQKYWWHAGNIYNQLTKRLKYPFGMEA